MQQKPKREVDRRRQHRYQLAALATFSWKETKGKKHRGEGYTRDVSKRGVFIVSDSCPPSHTKLRLDVILPPLKYDSAPVQMRGQGQVVRVEQGRTAKRKGFAAEVQHFTLRNKDLQDDCPQHSPPTGALKHIVLSSDPS